MRKAIAVVALLAGAAGSSRAVVNTQVQWQVSPDNALWSSDLIVAPGQQVWVRALVTYTGTPNSVGLASMTFQPVISHWDAAGASRDQATVRTPGEVSDPQNPGQFGRVSPFNRGLTSSTNMITGFVHMNGSGGAPPGSWLRIAQASAPSWLGGQGVPLTQLSNIGRTTVDPAFQPAIANLQVYKCGVVLSADPVTRDLVVDSPAAGFGNLNPNTGEREVFWYASMNEGTGSLRGTPSILVATIHVRACGSADFNGDGDSGTDADIEAFFACVAGSCCATCGSADFNADGGAGTDADIEAFFRVLAGGTC